MNIMKIRGIVLVFACLTAPAFAAEPDKPFARLGGTKLRHADRPLCVAFSPDGTKLYTGGKDGALRVWSVATGEPLASASFNSSHLLGLDFVQGGQRLAALYSDGGISFLNPATLTEDREVKLDRPFVAGLSADGNYAAVGEQLNTLTVYDTRTGLPRLELPDGPVAAMSPDGATVAAADGSGTIKLYRTVSGKPVYTAFHGGRVTHIRFSPNGKVFATADEQGAVRIWEPGRDKPLGDLTAYGPLAFLGENRLAAAYKGGIGLFDLTGKKWVRQLPGASGAFAASPDGKRLASTGMNGNRVRIWNLETGEQLHAQDDSFANVPLLLPGADGRSVTAIADAELFQWRPGSEKRSVLTRFSTPVTRAVLSDRLVAIQLSGIAIWDRLDSGDAVTAKPSRTLAVPGGANAVAIAMDGKLAAYADGEKQIVLFDPAAGKPLRTLPLSTLACELAFTPDGSRLAILGRDGWLRVWRLTDDREVWKHRFARNATGTLAVSGDGKWIAAATANLLNVLDAERGEVRITVEKSETESYFRTAAFSADGRHLFVGTSGLKGSIQVWDTTTREEVKRIASGGVNRLAVAADGRTVFAAGENETISAWSWK